MAESLSLESLDWSDADFFEKFGERDGTFLAQEADLWDFKKSWPFSYSDEYFAGIAKLVSAFANTAGGLIIFGVRDETRRAKASAVRVNVDRLQQALGNCLSEVPVLHHRKCQSESHGEVDVLVVFPRRTRQWAKVRVQGGKPLIEHDGIRARLAEMRMLIDATRSYLHFACWLADHREHGWDRSLAVFPKAMASQVAWQLAGWCLEIHGGHGYMKESGVEKLVRDAASALHGDGVNRTLFLKAANIIFPS